MRRLLLSPSLLILAFLFVSLDSTAPAKHAAGSLEVGFAEADITPDTAAKPVYLAGFGQNRIATGVLDPLKAQVVVLSDGTKKIAMVSLDIVGLFYPYVEEIRGQLAGFDYVMVSSTHNHEGPDTLGLWGPNPFTSGIDPDYMKFIQARVVKAVKEADKKRKPATAQIGTSSAADLLHDSREPYVKHDELVAIRFEQPGNPKPVGVIVQWNCHPETLASENTRVSADYVGHTIGYLQDRYNCPVVYFTGTVGGLMTSLHVPIKNEKGEELRDGSVEKTTRFGWQVGAAADRALKAAKAVELTPIDAKSRVVFLPLENRMYKTGRVVGILKRPAYHWTGDSTKAELADEKEQTKPLCMRTEVGWIHLGQLDIACIPGEIYPELVLSRVQDPVDPGADFPDAPIEPGIYAQLKGPYRAIIGLANDELGYIIPKRQWDEKAPYCYGRKKSQYGEVNSIGPQAAPVLCEAFRGLTR